MRRKVLILKYSTHPQTDVASAQPEEREEPRRGAARQRQTWTTSRNQGMGCQGHLLYSPRRWSSALRVDLGSFLWGFRRLIRKPPCRICSTGKRVADLSHEGTTCLAKGDAPNSPWNFGPKIHRTLRMETRFFAPYGCRGKGKADWATGFWRRPHIRQLKFREEGNRRCKLHGGTGESCFRVDTDTAWKGERPCSPVCRGKRSVSRAASTLPPTGEWRGSWAHTGVSARENKCKSVCICFYSNVLLCRHCTRLLRAWSVMFALMMSLCSMYQSHQESAWWADQARQLIIVEAVSKGFVAQGFVAILWPVVGHPSPLCRVKLHKFSSLLWSFSFFHWHWLIFSPFCSLIFLLVHLFIY